MKRSLAVLIPCLILGGAAGAASGLPPEGARATVSREAPRSAEVEPSLNALRATLAVALQETDFRRLLERKLRESEAGAISLRELVAEAGGSATVRRLAGLEAAARTAGLHIDLTVAAGPEGWNAATQVPLTTYVFEGPGGEASETLQAFDSAGAAVTVDPRQPLPFPLALLEAYDTRGAVEILSRPAPEAKSAAGGPSLVVDALFGQCYDSVSYRSYPLIVEAGIWDIHEGCCNGPQGFAYFTAAGSPKTGNLPASLGGASGWSTNVWASNLQGPYRISSSRDQWEWTADGWLQRSYRTYPAAYCQQHVASTASFALTSYTIKEHDDVTADDYVGKVVIDHRYCKSDVFDLGYSSGWTPVRNTVGIDDIEYTKYQLYCSSSVSCDASTQCPDGRFLFCTGSGSCSSGSCLAGDDWVQCGSYYQACGSQPPCPNGEIICPEEPL